jgi:type I restriction enzyme S subunit
VHRRSHRRQPRWLTQASAKPLHDKILLDKQISETLEEMTRALFKSWFVDFGPVRAKAEGRDPGLPGPLADLFPSSLVDSELGEIPEGWDMRTIGDLAEVVGGSTPRTADPTYWDNGSHAWATPKDLANLTAPALIRTARKVTDAGLSEIGSGLLPAGTVLLSSRAPIGYMAIAEIPVAVNQGFIAMRPRQVSSLFLMLWAKSSLEKIISYANGSTFLEISKANFRPIKLVCPSPKLLASFDRLAEPLYRKIVGQVRQSETLIALRDVLLPKLVSGEFRVPVAERVLEEAL